MQPQIYTKEKHSELQKLITEECSTKEEGERKRIDSRGSTNTEKLKEDNIEESRKAHFSQIHPHPEAQQHPQSHAHAQIQTQTKGKGKAHGQQNQATGQSKKPKEPKHKTKSTLNIEESKIPAGLPLSNTRIPPHSPNEHASNIKSSSSSSPQKTSSKSDPNQFKNQFLLFQDNINARFDLLENRLFNHKFDKAFETPFAKLEEKLTKQIKNASKMAFNESLTNPKVRKNFSQDIETHLITSFQKFTEVIIFLHQL